VFIVVAALFFGAAAAVASSATAASAPPSVPPSASTTTPTNTPTSTTTSFTPATTTSNAPLSGGQFPVSVTIRPGSLIISVPVKQTPVPGPGAGGAGALQPITVTDNRTDDLGWTVTAVLTGVTFAQQHAPSGLVWNPAVLSVAPGQDVTTGLGYGGARPSAAVLDTLSLNQPQILASASVGASLGTTRLAASLYLGQLGADWPTEYSATFTVTAI
jgi:hypothetical protein